MEKRNLKKIENKFDSDIINLKNKLNKVKELNKNESNLKITLDNNSNNEIKNNTQSIKIELNNSNHNIKPIQSESDEIINTNAKIIKDNTKLDDKIITLDSKNTDKPIKKNKKIKSKKTKKKVTTKKKTKSKTKKY